MFSKLVNALNILFCTVLVFQLAGCGTLMKKKNPKVSAFENAEFKRDSAEYNSLANQELRAKKLAEEEAVAKAEAKMKKEESENKGEGQVKVEF